MSLELFEEPQEENCEVEEQPDGYGEDSESESSVDESLNDMLAALKKRRMTSVSGGSSCFAKKKKKMLASPRGSGTNDRCLIGQGTTFVMPKGRPSSHSPPNNESTPSPLANVKATRSRSAPGRTSQTTPRRDSSLLGQRVLPNTPDLSRQQVLARTKAKNYLGDENRPPSIPHPPCSSSSNSAPSLPLPPTFLDQDGHLEDTGVISDNSKSSDEDYRGNSTSNDSSVTQALKNMTTVLNTLVKRVEDNASEIHALKTSIQTVNTLVPSSSSESSAKSCKRKIPSVVRVRLQFYVHKV